MSSGGARAQSGPAKDPNSGRSDRLGVSFTALDPAGYQGDIPEFPLAPVSVFFFTKDGDRVDDPVAERQRNEREAALWEWAWRTPQAIAWALEPWRLLSVANWVRLQAICETDEAKAADKTALLRLATQIGLSPEGLAANGWKIATPDLGEVAASSQTQKSGKKSSSRSRMKVVEGGDG